MSHRLHALGPPEAQGLYLLQIQKKRERDGKPTPSGFSSAANVASMQDVATEPKFQHNQITFSLDPSSQDALADSRKRRSSGQPRKCNNPSCDRIVTKRNFCYKCQKRKERGIALNPKLPSTKQVLLPSQQQAQQLAPQQQQQQQCASVKQERPLQPREEPSVPQLQQQQQHPNGHNESGGMRLSTIINEIFSKTPSPPSSSSNSSSTGSPPSYYPNSNVPTSFPSASHSQGHPLPTPRLLSHFPSQDSLPDTSPLASLALASVEQEQEQRKRKHKQHRHEETPATESQHQLPSIRSLMNDDPHPVHLSPAASHSDHRPFDSHNPLNQSSPPRPFQQHSPPSHQLQHQHQQQQYQHHHHHQTPMTDMNFCLGSQQDAGSERKHVPLPSFTFSSFSRPPTSLPNPNQATTTTTAGQTSTSTTPASFQSSGEFFSRTDLERFHSMLANYAGGEERVAALLDQYARSDLFKSLPRPLNHPAPAPAPGVSQGLPQLIPLFPPKPQHHQQQSASFSPSFYAQSLQNLSVQTPPFSPL